MQEAAVVSAQDREEVFRVRVSLERYFSDERARCYMCVSRGRTVRALARRLRRAFHLPRPFALISRGHLLPPDEPLALLHLDDPVDVIPTKSKDHKRSENTEDHSCPSPEDTPPLSPGTGGAHATKGGDCAPGERVAAHVTNTAPRYIDVTLGEETLDAMKRHALHLLEERSKPAPRRRRVRRRRARAPSPRELCTEAQAGPCVDFTSLASVSPIEDLSASPAEPPALGVLHGTASFDRSGASSAEQPALRELHLAASPDRSGACDARRAAMPRPAPVVRTGGECGRVARLVRALPDADTAPPTGL